jgi:phage-related protein
MAGNRPRAEYEIGAKDETSRGLKSAEGGLKKFGGAAKASFKVATVAAGAAVAAVAGLTAAINKLTDIYAVQEKAELGLAAAARNNPFINGEAVDGLRDAASALQQMSIYGDEAILPLMQLGVNMGYTQEQIERVSSAAVNLASATDMTLEAAFRNAYKTLGGFAGELGETIPAMKELTEEQLRAGEGLAVLEERFGGMAEAMARSTSGVKEQFKNLLGDVQEQIGAAFAPLSRILFQSLEEPLRAVGQWFEDNQQAITNFFLHFGEIARLTFNYVGQGLQNLFSWDSLLDIAKLYFDYLKTMFVNVGRFWWSVIQAIGTTIWLPLKKGFEHAIRGIRMLWQGFINKSAEGLDFLVTVPINNLIIAFKTAIHGIGNAIQWVMNGIVGLINKVVEGIDWIREGLHDLIQAALHPFDRSKREAYQGRDLGQLQDMDIEWLDPSLHQDLTTNLRRFVDDVNDIPEVETTWEDVWAGIRDSWVNVGETTVQAYKDQFEALRQLGSGIAEPMVEGFTGFTVEFKEIIARELPPAARNIVETFEEEFSEQIEAATDNMAEAITPPDRSWRRLWERVGEAVGGVRDRVVGFAENFSDGTRNAVGGVVAAIRNPGEAVGGVLQRISDGLAEAGHNLMDNMQSTSDESEEVTEETGKVANQLSGIAKVLVGILNWFADMIMQTEGMQNAIQLITDSLSAAFEGLVRPLIESIQPLIIILQDLINTTASALLPVFELLGDLVDALIPILTIVIQLFGQILTPVVDILSQAIRIVIDLIYQLTPILDSIANTLGMILAPIFDFIGQVLQAVAPVLQLVADILNALVPLFEGVAILLESILTPALQLVVDILNSVLTPVLTVLTQILTVLTPIFEIFGAIMKAITPIFDLLFKIISVLVLPLEFLAVIIEVLNPIFELLAWTLNLLIPVIQVLAWAVDLVSRPFEFLADLVGWLGIKLMAFGQALFYAITFQWGKFGDIDWGGGFTSDAFKRPLIDVTSSPDVGINAVDVTGFDGTATTTSDMGTSGGYGAGAQYGGTNLTVNVTIQAEAIVGEPGLQEFALMIQDEIERAQSLGIA